MNLNKSTLSEQIYQILRTDILTQKIPLGEKLTLKNLQEQFGVSSTPIREALTRLSQDGLVNYYSNIGVNVISLSENDLKELYQFMGDLDRLAILYTADHPEHDQICQELQHLMQDFIFVFPIKVNGFHQNIQLVLCGRDEVFTIYGHVSCVPLNM